MGAVSDETFSEDTDPLTVTLGGEDGQQEDDDTEPDGFMPAGGGTANHGAASYTDLKRVGVNVKTGLDYCCGDEEFYMDMLRMFCSQAPEKKAEIITLYETENWSDYTVKVHALKSTSLTVGAERLAEQAKMLEQAGKKNDTDYIRQNHLQLLDLYDETCKCIAAL